MKRQDLTLFFVLACALTWLADLALDLAWLRGQEPAGWAVGLAGLGAWGPTLAALLVAARRGEARSVWGSWHGSAAWVVLALLAPAALHLPATLLEVALGGTPAQWFYPPVKPEHVAALVMFSLGEEFGWRGYAYPRLVDSLGLVRGSLLLGAVWGLWHLGMMVTPAGELPTLSRVVLMVVELALYSVVMAWVFEQGGRSMVVALAFHAGGHLDNVNRAPETEIRLRMLRLLVLAVAAVAAGVALRARERRRGA